MSIAEGIDLPAGGWEPRFYQRALWNYLQEGGTRAVAIWHRRSGKDEIALHWTACAMWNRPAMYWHMLPEQAQARKAIWNAVNPHSGKRRIDEAFPLELRETTRDDEMLIRLLNGSIWQVVGSDNYNSLVGSPPAGVVFSEYALANPSAWAYLRPILTENGGWALFITTPRGKNHAKTMLDNFRRDNSSFAEVLRADQTRVLSPQVLAKELRDYMDDFGQEHGRALFEQEYMCSFDAAIIGAFYADELRRAYEEERIGVVPAERGILVETAWDLGYEDATAIWFIQRIGREVRIVDYFEDNHADLAYFADIVHQKAKDYGWVYGTHWFPNDVEVHELNTGTSRASTLRSLGILPATPMDKKINKSDGINATRRLLARAWIDEKRCARGIDCLANYRRKWDEKNKTFSPNEIHDWSSHGSDALRVYACAVGDFTAPRRKLGHDVYDEDDDRRGSRGVWAY